MLSSELTGSVLLLQAHTLSGENVGVAHEASIHSLRVLDCDGDGKISDVIAALDWVARNGKRPALATLSLGIRYKHLLLAHAFHNAKCYAYVAHMVLGEP